MSSFGIATVNHGRPKVFELWCAHIKRLRYDIDMYIPVVCVSDEEDKPVCDKYNIIHFTHPNKPVSAKWDVAFKYFWNIGVDYVMILDSDDIMSTDLLRKVFAEMQKGISLIGIDTIYFFSGDGIHKGKLVRFQHKRMLGVVKSIHKDILDAVGWKPFDMGKDPITGEVLGKNWGINAIATKAIAPYVTTKSIVDGVVVDLKTKDNINKWTCFGLRYPLVDTELFYNILNAEEKQLLAKI